ncbi:hypothetical protein SAMN05216480_101252 [Pustulibacterium marinum]|uniref:Flavoprotein, HI0933 family n=1 Tax=Pustulibacterium marinum TaxID=1224947 RepID=A0A1I7EUQ6_9FLAO|nr:NAD(P)/FAD-dependent oxidoreductase [Pustulibacterium marinum]SFU27664.1 hypothetical protein SAMN05216480_101252 [Pustulibacterium marinum]
MKTDVLVIGGGAAGFFSAINIAQQSNLRVTIVERGKEVLGKVKISGGGRCNVTHAEFIPNELAKNYPRGEKELRGPFHSFMSGDVMGWFEERGIALKIEEDGRVFPASDDSQTIIDCFLQEAEKYGVKVLRGHTVKTIQPNQNKFNVVAGDLEIEAQKVVVATGSNPKVWKLLETLGHTVIQPVPSLFTFNSKDARIKNLPGVVANVSTKVLGSKLSSQGPLLITHWGMSGPAILKLSAWGARILNEKNYQFQIEINWLQHASFEEVLDMLKAEKQENPKKQIINSRIFELPKRLWESIVVACEVQEVRWADSTKKQLQQLAKELTQATFNINGKSTFKEEFVTAGGVKLKEINFKTFESKLHKNLFFAGEVLNIDAITGGFNFQNAWTSGFLVAKSIAEN